MKRKRPEWASRCIEFHFNVCVRLGRIASVAYQPENLSCFHRCSHLLQASRDGALLHVAVDHFLISINHRDGVPAAR